MFSLKVPASTTTEAIREAVEEADREMAKLAAHASAESAAELVEFRLAWGRLAELLVLGPPPRRRTCPYCGCGM